MIIDTHKVVKPNRMRQFIRSRRESTTLEVQGTLNLESKGSDHIALPQTTSSSKHSGVCLSEILKIQVAANKVISGAD